MESDITLTNELSPAYNVTFSNGNGEVGRLEFDGNEMKFIGKADKAADVFFNHFLKSLCDQYLATNRR